MSSIDLKEYENCIFSDEIICNKISCRYCEIYYQKTGSEPRQLEMEEVVLKYGTKKEK